MVLAPLAHALDIGRAAEVVLVLWFAQPASLAQGLAGSATLGLGTKLLMPPIARIGHEQLFAMQAFAAITEGHRRCEQNHGQEVNCPPRSEPRTSKKTDLKEEKKSLERSSSKKKDREEDCPVLRRQLQNKITPRFPVGPNILIFGLACRCTELG